MSDKKTIERLQELLDQRDEELAEARGKLEKIDNFRDKAWMHHRVVEGVDGTDDVENLPVPRLQMRFEGETYETVITYELVYRHALDGVGNGPKFVYIPLGITTRRGGNSKAPADFLKMPFRDGVHLQSDARQLKLPAYAVYEGKAYKIDTEKIEVEVE